MGVIKYFFISIIKIDQYNQDNLWDQGELLLNLGANLKHFWFKTFLFIERAFSFFGLKSIISKLIVKLAKN